MFSRILYPTDFSSVSRKAADHILQLRNAGAQEVVILHVIDAAALMAPAGPGVLGGIGTSPTLNQRAIDDWHASAEEECARLADTFSAAGFDARALIEVGEPADVILRKAEEEDIAVIVLGATGKGHLAELILGSVSDRVLRESRWPVFVVKP